MKDECIFESRPCGAAVWVEEGLEGGLARRIARGKDKEGMVCAVCRSDRRRAGAQLLKSLLGIDNRRTKTAMAMARGAKVTFLLMTEVRNVSRCLVEWRCVSSVPCEAGRVEELGKMAVFPERGSATEAFSEIGTESLGMAYAQHVVSAVA